MATDIIISWLLMRDARRSERKLMVAQAFMERMLSRAADRASSIQSEDADLFTHYKGILNLA
jgi:hypothetical protein